MLSPEPWQQGEAQTVVRGLENNGLLDFELIRAADIPGLCLRAGFWPDGMPEILDRDALGLTGDEIEAEEKRCVRARKQKQKQRLIEGQRILFAGTLLDTDDPNFADKHRELADSHMKNDDSWFERSRQRTRLVQFEYPEHSARGPGGSGNGGRSRRQEGRLNDTQRQAMGLAGEYFAYVFLRRLHSEYVDETCWISENRSLYFGGDEGDDSAGFDFQVKTPQRPNGCMRLSPHRKIAESLN